MTRLDRIRARCGYFDGRGPPRTVEAACQKFHELDSEFPQFYQTDEDERAAIKRELNLVWNLPAPWGGRDADWERLHGFLRKAIERTHERTPPNSSSEDEPDFDDQSEYLSPAGDPSHQPALFGRAYRAGGHANYMPSHHASHIESSDGEATPPPSYSDHLYPGAHNARRHGEVHEAPRHPGGYNTGGYNTGGFREEHGNFRHHGGRNNRGLCEEHSNSRHLGGYNTGGFHEEHGNFRHHGGRNNRGLCEEHSNSRHLGGYNTGGFHEEHGNSRHHGGYNIGGFREEHGNSRHHGGYNIRGFQEEHGNFRRQGDRNNGGFHEDHGNSRRQGSLNAAHSHVGSLEPDTSSESDAEASLSASESYHTDASNVDLRYMDRVRIPEERRTDWVRTRDTVLQNQMRQQPNPLPSGRRRRGGWRD